MNGHDSPAIDLAAYHLTPRECDVVDRIAEGLEIKEIARELGIGYHTAKMHIRSAKGKMHARNQLEVAILLHGGTPQSMAGMPAVERGIEQAPAWPQMRFGVARR